MPIYRVQAPDGTVLRIEGPDDATQDQLTAVAQQHYEQLARPNPTDQSQYPEASTAGNVFAGIGKGLEDLGLGIGQRVGLVKQSTIDERRKLDAPLMQTTAGRAGDFAGTLAGAVPTAFIPGANTVLGAGLIGAGLGAAQPTAGNESALKNAALGGMLGAGAQFGLGKLAQLANSRLSAATAAGEQQAVQNATRDATLSEARRAGYVIPPVQANPSLPNRLAEGFAGKLSTAQQASIKNQPLTDSLIKSDLGIPANQPVTRENLEAVRNKAGQAYEALKQAGQIVPDEAFASRIANLGGADYAAMLKDFPEMANGGIADLSKALSKPEFSASSAVSLIKQLRKSATGNYNAARAAGGDQAKLALASAQDDAASAIEGLIERNLAAQGKGDLVQKFQEARTLIAKAHDAERALNPATGSFAASDFARMLDKGRPLSGGALTVGKTASAFPKAAQEITSSMPGVSPLDYAAVGSVSAAAHNPGIMASLMMRPIVRSAILSRPYQRAFAGAPDYAPGLLARSSPKVLKELQDLGIAGLLSPSIYSTQQ